MNNARNGELHRLGTLAAMLLALASVLGIVVAGDNVLTVDVDISCSIQQWQGDTAVALQTTGDMLGSTTIALALVVTGIAIALLKKQPTIAVFLTGVATLRVVALVLKPIFNSPRPQEEYVRILEPYKHNGYPSGHSITIAVLAAVATVLVWKFECNSLIRWLVPLMGASLMILVGWSRIWAGAHWPSDVLGGWCYGVGLTLVAWIIAERWALTRLQKDSHRG